MLRIWDWLDFEIFNLNFSSQSCPTTTTSNTLALTTDSTSNHRRRITRTHLITWRKSSQFDRKPCNKGLKGGFRVEELSFKCSRKGNRGSQGDGKAAFRRRSDSQFNRERQIQRKWCVFFNVRAWLVGGNSYPYYNSSKEMTWMWIRLKNKRDRIIRRISIRKGDKTPWCEGLKR